MIRHDRWQEWEAARRADETTDSSPQLVHPGNPVQQGFAEPADENPQPGSKLVH